MNIKKARPSDARKISLLRRRTIREINKNDYPKVFIKFLVEKNSPQEIIEEMKKRQIFCAWEGEIMLGTVYLNGDIIGGLYVKSSENGKGIGTKLMDFIEKYALSKKIRRVRLYSTKYAYNFYKKRGYRPLPSGYWILGKSKTKNRVMGKRLKK